MSASAEERLARLEQAHQGTGYELRDIKDRLKLLDALHELIAQNKTMLDTLKDHDGRLKAIEDKPAKRWDAMIGSALAAVVGAVVGWLMGR